jgi:predicted permease
MYREIQTWTRADGGQPGLVSGVLARFGFALHIGYGGRTERVAGELVSGTYFPVLGIAPALGRTLTPDDDRAPNAAPYAVLSHAFWTSRFAADPTVVGRPIVVNGNAFTIVGVAREGFEGVELGRPVQVWVPMMMKAQITPGWNGLDDPRYYWVRVFARMQPGVTPQQVEAALQPSYRARLELEAKEKAFANASPRIREQFVASTLVAQPSAQGRSGFRRNLTRPLWVLMAIAAGVLLIACANVANLLLARGAGRQREMAVRLALGAGRGRLVRQLLVESVLLAILGGVAGLAVAIVGAPLVLGFFVVPGQPEPISTLPDLRILAFTFAVSMLTGVLFGLTPALQSTRPNVAPTLKDHAGSVLGGQARLRKALVASQVAVSLLLLIGAGLFIRTLNNLLKVDVGLRTEQLIVFTVDPSLNGYTPDRTKTFAKTLLERLNGAPGVVSAGLASQRLLEGNQWGSGTTIEGYTPKGDENMTQLSNAVTPGYFKAMGLPILLGRDFDQRDERSGPAPEGAPDFRVAIVNERFVKQYFPNGNPIGRHIGFGIDPGTKTPIEIIGVARDAKYTDVRSETQRQVFFPFLESAQPRGATAYVRTSRDAESMFAQVRQIVQQIDPNLPIYGTRTVENQVALSLSNERMIATMSIVFGTLATLLAVVGLYGVMAYTVSRRTREIGIRMALGARMSNIGWLVIREVLTIVTLGIVIGLPAAWWLGRYVSSQLFGVLPTDPLTIAGAVLALGLTALLAGLVPSARAARVSPTIALRYE